MNERRLKGLLGLCVRAGQGVFGEDSCLKALRGGQAELAVMDAGISPGSAERFERLCSREGFPLHRLPEGFLEEATGKPGMTMVIRPGSFAIQIRACLEE